jgi:rfaE bifunctional protein kinase chain/domain
MTSNRLQSIAAKYPQLQIAVVGDYCLDRYLEINPARAETSIETGLPVHNVERVRPQPGAAGTVLNNLVDLGVGRIYPVGFCGDDGEGYELKRALKASSGVDLTYFVQSAERNTFTYTKPLVMAPGRPPQELSRIDTKNWTSTPEHLSKQLASSLAELLERCDAVIVMDQVDLENTGTVTTHVLETLRAYGQGKLVIADSRRGLGNYPPCLFKMNSAELGRLFNHADPMDESRTRSFTLQLAERNRYPAVVTMAEQGLMGANPDGTLFSTPALPLRGPIDIVGAGDSVTANLAAALAADASLEDALSLAALASSVVIHQLGTSGSASIREMEALLGYLKPQR